MKDLFGNDIPDRQELPKKMSNKSAAMAHASLRLMHGEVNDKLCKNCANCIKTGNSTTFYKCTLFSTSHSESSDWRANWKACGKYIETKK